MKCVVFGLTVSSSWANGHATLWRGLCRALGARGHDIVFFERDVEYYASHRDLDALPGGGRLHLYARWADVRELAKRELDGADVGMVTSFCPDARAAEALVVDGLAAVSVFYDLDTPVTRAALSRQQAVPYLGPRGLRDYDLVLSYAGGESLDWLRSALGARAAAPLYGSVDPSQHHPTEADAYFESDLSYLGTYSSDRQAMVQRLFIDSARHAPHRRFVLGGSQYPIDFPWAPNIWYVRHVPPREHPAFYASSRLTLNVTRQPMADAGFCPSGRLFEAAACGAPIISDSWAGLETFFRLEEEILVAGSSVEVLDALERPDAELKAVGRRARARALESHTADNRAREFERLLQGM
jgi:spore maturation protein CgeB